MKRREFLWKSAGLGALAAMPAYRLVERLPLGLDRAHAASSGAPQGDLKPLTPPRSGNIPVALVLSRGAVMIDFAGPWQVFQDVWIPSRGRTMAEQMPFRTYTVAEKPGIIRVSGGMKIVPNYTFATAPPPSVIVIPAQNGDSKVMRDWIRKASQHADITMSVCTGAFILAQTGLLHGKAATTHHTEYREFQAQFADVQVKRGVRFVDEGEVASSGGLSSGIDLALHVVERYFGHQAAADTAYNMEYQGQGWMNPDSNAVYLKAGVSTDQHPLCPVCEMEVDPATAPSSSYKGKTYYFCSGGHKAEFDAAPEKWQ